MPPNRLLLLVISLLLLVIAIGVFSSRSVRVVPVPTSPPAAAPTTEAPITQTPQSAPVPSFTPTPHGVAPATAQDVAGELGGSPSQWMKQDEWGRRVGDNGWIFQSRGQTPLQFTVAPGCVVDTSTGRLYAGASVNATDLTIYWL